MKRNKIVKKITSIVLIVACLFTVFAMSVSAKYTIVTFGNRCGTQVVRNVTNRTVGIAFSNYWNTWSHVELLSRNGKVVWDCWVGPNEYSRFWCGSNVYSIRLSSSGVSRADVSY